MGSHTFFFNSLVTFENMARLLLAGVFMYAGIRKLADPESLKVVIESLGLAPGGVAAVIALVLPVVEVITAAGLMLNIQGSLEVILVLLLLFVLVISYGIWLGVDIDCGCFGPADPEARVYGGLKAALVRDLLMISLVLFLKFRSTKKLQSAGNASG